MEPSALKITRKMKYNYILLAFAIIIRVYFVLRHTITRSYFFKPRSQRFCKIYGVDITLFFGIKCVLKTYPLTCISLMCISNVVVGAYIIRIFERNLYLVYNSNLNNFSNDIWYSFISMTTSNI